MPSGSEGTHAAYLNPKMLGRSTPTRASITPSPTPFRRMRLLVKRSKSCGNFAHVIPAPLSTILSDPCPILASALIFNACSSVLISTGRAFQHLESSLFPFACALRELRELRAERERLRSRLELGHSYDR